jgi:hypothetical protein
MVSSLTPNLTDTKLVKFESYNGVIDHEDYRDEVSLEPIDFQNR